MTRITRNTQSQGNGVQGQHGNRWPRSRGPGSKGPRQRSVLTVRGRRPGDRGQTWDAPALPALPKRCGDIIIGERNLVEDSSARAIPHPTIVNPSTLPGVERVGRQRRRRVWHRLTWIRSEGRERVSSSPPLGDRPAPVLAGGLCATKPPATYPPRSTYCQPGVRRGSQSHPGSRPGFIGTPESPNACSVELSRRTALT
jgi:hypothetical protein